MPVNSNRFNRYLGLIWVCVGYISTSTAAFPQLPTEHQDWLADRIFANECNREFSCLTHWNNGENFPSMGIGHFIWYQQGQQEIFEETFPPLLKFLQDSNVDLPEWLNPPLQADNPWPNQTDFNAAKNTGRMRELQILLSNTRGLQAQFIANRLSTTLEEIIASFPAARQSEMDQIVSKLTDTNSPLGVYALIDYLHFKGSGLKESERYRQQGWGLRQVLDRMSSNNASLETYVAAATEVLEDRVMNAPAERNEQRWLRGWINRLHTYLPTK